jgi:hypothetical protein
MPTQKAPIDQVDVWAYCVSTVTPEEDARAGLAPSARRE